MSLRNFFNHRIRGVRAVELWAGGLTLALALGVYLAKNGAGDVGSDIAHAQSQIGDEQRQIRLLKAEVAYLEQPERLERLSSAYLGLQPLAGTHETVIDNLQEVANTRLPTGALKSAVPILTPDIARAQAEAGAMAESGAAQTPGASPAPITTTAALAPPVPGVASATPASATTAR